MKKSLLLIIFFCGILSAQSGKDKDEPVSFEKIASIKDRAGGTHNVGNIGLFFENRGKLYPRRITQGPSGEFPINSGRHYIYRINPMIGIPGNVIQGRRTDNEKWEAAYGYQNPSLSQIAFSDKKESWHPTNGWPVKDEKGNPKIFSDQDSYCVYNDSTNTIKILNIEVQQAGYQYGVNFAKDILFYKFIVINRSPVNYDKLYFAMYTDIDVGNASGGDPEYKDDKLGFIKEKNFVYYYDADGVSSEWPGGPTGLMGVALLRTPKVNGVELGMTDMHYYLYDDDENFGADTTQYGIMSSALTLYNHPTVGPKFFHMSSSQNRHFDDTASIPATGLDLCATIGSGPYTINSGDTLIFYTAIVAGEDKAALLKNLEQSYKILDYNFEISKPPATPTLKSVAGDGTATLFWDDVAEASKDGFTGEYDFEGYRVYRSVDKGIHWSLLADYDKINDLGLDKGLQYSYTDTKLVNGIEYWYSVTAYDRGSSDLESLESPKGSGTDAKNLNSVIPRSEPLGKTPVSAETAEISGMGKTNYVLLPKPVNNDNLAGGTYDVSFSYSTRTERGNLKTGITVNISDSSKALPNMYGIVFKSEKVFDIVDLTTGTTLKEDNTYIPRIAPGILYSKNGSVIPGIEFRLFDPNPTAPADSLPVKGDRLTISFSINIAKNDSFSVIKNRPFTLGKTTATTDGVLFEIKPPNVIQTVSRILGKDIYEIEFSAADETAVKTGLYMFSVTAKGFDSTGASVITIQAKHTDTAAVNIANLRNQDSFTYMGIKGVVKFPESSPPGTGNVYTVDVLKPIAPGLKDKFRFKIKPAVLNRIIEVAEVNKIKVVPNPYVVSSIYEPEYGELRKEPLRQIQFINLPMECTIYIFTVDADLVKTLRHSSTSGTETWDLRSESGREIAPGMYIYVVKNDLVNFKSRFAVIK